MRIYACDDELLALVLLEDAIRSSDRRAQLKGFSSSEELLNAFKEERCDVVFLDVHMPGMTGLELAGELKKLYSRINIVFVTGFDNFYPEAMDMFASGYVLKPVTREKVLNQLQNLRYPVHKKEDGLYAQTFGNFALFYNGKAIHFTRYDSKQMIAYLIDRRGADVTRRELASVLFEDEDYSRPIQTRLSMVVHDMRMDLEKIGIKDLVIHKNNSYSINRDMLNCDLFDYLDNDNKELYNGEYMEQYSWSENFKALHDNNVNER